MFHPGKALAWEQNTVQKESMVSDGDKAPRKNKKTVFLVFKSASFVGRRSAFIAKSLSEIGAESAEFQGSQEAIPNL